jgi:hypothetical protein
MPERAPLVGDREAVAGVEVEVEEGGVEVAPVGQQADVERHEQPLLDHDRDDAIRGHRDVVAGVALAHAGEHVVLAGVGVVDDADAAGGLEVADGVVGDVGRPVVDGQRLAGEAVGAGPLGLGVGDGAQHEGRGDGGL